MASHLVTEGVGMGGARIEFTIEADPLTVYLAAPGTEFPGGLTFELPPLTLRDRWHVFAGEVFGWISGWALVKVAKHARAAKDGVTAHRVSEVLTRGVEVGWSKDDPDGGKIVPGRGRGRSYIPEPVISHVYRDSLTGVTRTSPPPGRSA